MTLTRHTQVENLSTLLRLRRARAAQGPRRDLAYRQLVAALLDVPADRLVPAAAASRIAPPAALPLATRRTRAA